MIYGIIQAKCLDYAKLICPKDCSCCPSTVICKEDCPVFSSKPEPECCDPEAEGDCFDEPECEAEVEVNKVIKK